MANKRLLAEMKSRTEAEDEIFEVASDKKKESVIVLDSDDDEA